MEFHRHYLFIRQSLTILIIYITILIQASGTPAPTGLFIMKTLHIPFLLVLPIIYFYQLPMELFLPIRVRSQPSTTRIIIFWLIILQQMVPRINCCLLLITSAPPAEFLTTVPLEFGMMEHIGTCLMKLMIHSD